MQSQIVIVSASSSNVNTIGLQCPFSRLNLVLSKGDEMLTYLVGIVIILVLFFVVKKFYPKSIIENYRIAENDAEEAYAYFKGNASFVQQTFGADGVSGVGGIPGISGISEWPTGHQGYSGTWWPTK